MRRTIELMLFVALALGAACCRAEQADRDKPIHLEADKVLIDDARQVSRFEGHVQLLQGTLRIQADTIEVREDANGYQHMTAYGHPAKFRQRYQDTDQYAEGYGDRIEYDTRTEVVDFYEHARVKRGQDEVQGAFITYSTKTEVFEARGGSASPDSGDGRVRAVLQPKRDKPPEPAGSPAPLDITPSERLSTDANSRQ